MSPNNFTLQKTEFIIDLLAVIPSGMEMPIISTQAGGVEMTAMRDTDGIVHLKCRWLNHQGGISLCGVTKEANALYDVMRYTLTRNGEQMWEHNPVRLDYSNPVTEHIEAFLEDVYIATDKRVLRYNLVESGLEATEWLFTSNYPAEGWLKYFIDAFSPSVKAHLIGKHLITTNHRVVSYLAFLPKER